LPIEKLFIKGDAVDLYLQIGDNRKWLSGGGKNIPALKYSPPPTGVVPMAISVLTKPLYYSGKRIAGVSLTFKTVWSLPPPLQKMRCFTGNDSAGECG